MDCSRRARYREARENACVSQRTRHANKRQRQGGGGGRTDWSISGVSQAISHICTSLTCQFEGNRVELGRDGRLSLRKRLFLLTTGAAASAAGSGEVALSLAMEGERIER